MNNQKNAMQLEQIPRVKYVSFKMWDFFAAIDFDKLNVKIERSGAFLPVGKQICLIS